MSSTTLLCLLSAIGIAGGALTTVSGIGGGLAVWSATALVMPLRDALAVSAVALLAGNCHRAWLYRGLVDRTRGLPLAFGLVAGALGGAPVIARVPPCALRAMLVATCVAALARAGWRFVVRMSRGALIASGIAAGILGAGGGAGVLFAPILQAAGLTGDPYVATVAVVSILYNAARVFGYAAAGMYHGPLAGAVAVLAVALIAGNLVGERVRRAIPHRACRAIETGAPVLAIALALV